MTMRTIQSPRTDILTGTCPNGHMTVYLVKKGADLLPANCGECREPVAQDPEDAYGVGHAGL